MRTLADLKRRMTPGKTVTITNLLHPHLSGERTILRAQGKQWCMTFPVGHEKHDPATEVGSRRGSWLDIPKAGDVVFDGDTATLHTQLRYDSPERGPWLVIEVTA